VGLLSIHSLFVQQIKIPGNSYDRGAGVITISSARPGVFTNAACVGVI